MKFIFKNKSKPKIGDIRIKTTFLFLPLTLNGITIWLEKVQIEQQFVEASNICDGSISYWQYIRFINN